jgi:hypothetical protein
MTITSKFNGKCKACGGFVAVGDKVNWVKGVQGVTHADATTCASYRNDPYKAAVTRGLPTAAPVVTANAKPVADFLTAARERGLKFPKVAFMGPNGAEIKLTLAGPASKNPGAVFVYDRGLYVGSIATDGTVRGALANNAALLGTLAAIITDPAAAAKAYGMLTGRCSFCAKELTDAGSVEVGYGPVCAKKYGLPHTAKGTSKQVTLDPSMPLTYGPNAAVFAQAADSVDRADDYYSELGGW